MDGALGAGMEGVMPKRQPGIKKTYTTSDGRTFPTYNQALSHESEVVRLVALKRWVSEAFPEDKGWREKERGEVLSVFFKEADSLKTLLNSPGVWLRSKEVSE